jgi:hypothetical protein
MPDDSGSPAEGTADLAVVGVRTDEDAVAFGGETVLVAAGAVLFEAAAGETMKQAVEKAFKNLKKPPVLAASTFRSESTAGGNYRLEFRVANATDHGLYIEGLELVDPDADSTSLRLVHYTSRRLPSMTGTDNSPRPFPIWLAPTGWSDASTRLLLDVHYDAKQWFATAKVGIARATISLLSHGKPLSVAWRFMIRH